eukprot:151544_1
MALRKRTLRILEAAQQKSAKRHKKNNVNPHDDSFSEPIPSSFKHPKDQRQFTRILQAVQSSKLSTQLEVPQEVNITISEYAVGVVNKCKNRNCSNRIVVLNSDITFGKLTKDVYDNYMKKNCYCVSCKIHTETCEDCGLLLYEPRIRKCYVCDYGIRHCENKNCSSHKRIQHCDECRNCICNDCTAIFRCRRWDGWLCNATICYQCKGEFVMECCICGQKQIVQHKTCVINEDEYRTCMHNGCDKLICDLCHSRNEDDDSDCEPCGDYCDDHIPKSEINSFLFLW